MVDFVHTIEEIRATYDRVFELNIATPQTVATYAERLVEHEHFEEAFKVYERGLILFSNPVAFELWNLYLTKAVAHKISVERLRNLFEQAIKDVPAKFARSMYLMYGQLEEERGLTRFAMRIYDRATRAVLDDERPSLFDFYINQVASNFGMVATRPVYARAIITLFDDDAKIFCLRFADMEMRLGEIDRARTIFHHGSRFADPRIDESAYDESAYWPMWARFEVRHGNEETFKEMLCIKGDLIIKLGTGGGLFTP